VRKFIAVSLLAIVAVAAAAKTTDTGDTLLKDVQPVGITDKKHKHQQFDLSFVTGAGTTYTCRTAEKEKVKATDFVVGSNVNYKVVGNKGKVKDVSGKGVNCTIVRVANSSPAVLNEVFAADSHGRRGSFVC
jgi:gentisate 1,2-dioxygenase